MSKLQSPAPARPIGRRSAIRWMAAVSALAAGASGLYLFDPGADPDTPAEGAGYGTDPKLSDYVAPWPRLLTAAQRATVDLLCDHILPAEGDAPAASALQISELVDEWVSAPYPTQVADRKIILPGLDWVDAEVRARGGRALAKLAPAARDDILAAWTGEGRPGRQPAPKDFYTRLRWLTVGAYYTTEAGFAEIGYIGNQALTAFPAISAETRSHLEAAFARLGI